MKICFHPIWDCVVIAWLYLLWGYLLGFTEPVLSQSVTQMQNSSTVLSSKLYFCKALLGFIVCTTFLLQWTLVLCLDQIICSIVSCALHKQHLIVFWYSMVFSCMAIGRMSLQHFVTRTSR